MAKSNIEKIKNQAITDEAQEYARLLRQRAVAKGYTIESLNEALGWQYDESHMLIKLLSGYDIPETQTHFMLSEQLGLLPETELNTLTNSISSSIAMKNRTPEKIQEQARSKLRPQELTVFNASNTFRSKRKAAEASLDGIERPTFNSEYMTSSMRRKTPKTDADLKEARQELVNHLKDRVRDGRRGILTAELTSEDTVAHFFGHLSDYFEIRKSPLSELMSFEYGTINNWVNDRGSLPKRENFAKAQEWLDTQFPHMGVADKFTEMYIREAIPRYRKGVSFRNLPQEFWEAKIRTTNDATFRFSDDAPSWIDQVKPCEHAGEYIKCARRALGYRREAVAEHAGVSKGALRSLEVENNGGHRVANGVIDLIAELSEELTQEGYAPLFIEKTFDSLAQPSTKKTVGQEKPKTRISGEKQHGGKDLTSIKKAVKHTANDIRRKLDLDDNQSLTIIGFPEDDVMAISQITLQQIEAVISKARSYYWVESDQEETFLEKALKQVVKDTNAGLSR